MSAVRIVGMWGFGDNLHQRAIIRELMKSHEVWLDTCHYAMYHDLIAKGLHLILRPTSLRTQAKNILREKHLFTNTTLPFLKDRRVMRYNKQGTDWHGSILAAMFATADVPMPEYPDFSLPIPGEWIDKARSIMSGWDMQSKPLLVYRPTVLRAEWNQAQRNPDWQYYAALFQAIRKKFFVLSIADLEPRSEWIDGLPQHCDMKFHRGELDFPTMAAFFKLADMVMSPAGFGPVLAQAVGTPIVAVYGCREDFHITERVGAHLAPTLGIDIDQPKRCLSAANSCLGKCNKKITLAPAIERLHEFVEQHVENCRMLVG